MSKHTQIVAWMRQRRLEKTDISFDTFKKTSRNISRKRFRIIHLEICVRRYLSKKLLEKNCPPMNSCCPCTMEGRASLHGGMSGEKAGA